MLTKKKIKFAVFIAERRASGEKPVISEAALHAGYAEKSVHQAASRLMKDEAVLAHIEHLLKPQEEIDLEQAAAEVKVKYPRGEEEAKKFDCPKEFLEHVMNEFMMVDPKLAVDSAKALLPYHHVRKGDLGKKKQLEEQAKEKQGGSAFKPRVVK